MSALVTGLIGAITEAGISRISKTKVAVNVATINAIAALLPGVMAKDPQAIVQMLSAIVLWLGTLWARGNKG